MKKFIKWCCGGYCRDFFKKHQVDILKHNAKILEISLGAIACFLLTFIVLNVFDDSFTINIPVYSVVCALMVGMYIFLKVYAHKSFRITSIMFQAFLVIIGAFLVYDYTILYPDRLAVMLCVFGIVVPIVIITPQYNTLFICLGGYIVYLVFGYIFKDRAVFYLDAIYELCCLVASTFIGHFVLRNTLDNYDLNDKLKYQTRYDPLTNIYNRRAARKRLEEIYQNVDDIAVAMVDIDGFKQYNDTYGHIKGDTVLKTIASIFLKNVQKYGCFVSRFGGEEFLVVTYGANVDKMEEIIIDSMKEFAETNIENVNSPIGRVSFSVGYTKTNKKDNFSKLLDTADQGLYMAKSQGKNLYVYNEYSE